MHWVQAKQQFTYYFEQSSCDEAPARLNQMHIMQWAQFRHTLLNAAQQESCYYMQLAIATRGGNRQSGMSTRVSPVLLEGLEVPSN